MEQFAKLVPGPEGVGYPSWDTSDNINGRELAYGVEFSDDSKEWAIVVQLTYNQAGMAHWLITYTECDGGAVKYNAGCVAYRAGNQPEMEIINQAIRVMTLHWINPLNKEG